MKRIWNAVNGMKMKTDSKNRIFLDVMMLINTVLGAAIWLLVGRLLLPEISWLFCFMGYSAICVGFFGGLIYLFNHEFV